LVALISRLAATVLSSCSESIVHALCSVWAALVLTWVLICHLAADITVGTDLAANSIAQLGTDFLLNLGIRLAFTGLGALKSRLAATILSSSSISIMLALRSIWAAHVFTWLLIDGLTANIAVVADLAANSIAQLGSHFHLRLAFTGLGALKSRLAATILSSCSESIVLALSSIWTAHVLTWLLIDCLAANITVVADLAANSVAQLCSHSLLNLCLRFTFTRLGALETRLAATVLAS